MRAHPIVLACLLLLCPIATAAVAEDAPYQARIDAIMDAIQDDDRETVAAAIRYPLQFWDDGDEMFRIGNPADLLVNFDVIFSADNKRRLRRLETREYARFTQGIMLGDGEIWFTKDAMQIRTLNLFDAPVALDSAAFGDAFSRSKALGLDSFTWRGTPYTTKEAER